MRLCRPVIAGLVAAAVMLPATSHPQGADPAQLGALETAYKAGLLTREEYEAKKRQLLGGAGGRPPAEAAPGRWVRHQSPLGFQLQHPAGWVVETPGSNLIVVRSQDGASFALARPFLQGGTTCARFLRESFGQPSTRFPGARVTSVAQRRQQPDEAVAVVSFRNGQSRANVLCSLLGGSGMIFAVAAPAAQFDAQKEALVQILTSFSVTQPSGPAQGGGAPAPRVAYTRFTDPREGAFTIDVPRGWRTEGGILRRSAIDLVAALRTTAPDGSTTIFIGDPELRTCAWSDNFMGASEGQTYDPGFGTQMVILRYQPGLVFAGNYLQRFVQSLGLGNVQVRDRRERPDLVELGNRQAAQQNANPMGASRSTAGEIAFTAQRGGQTLAGYLLATTTVWPAPGGYQWNAVVVGYVTPSDQAAATSSIFAHILASAQLNPQWAGQQQQTTGATAGIVGDAGQAIAQIQSDSYWARQQTQGEVMRRHADAILGQVRVRDPNTGEEFETAAGKNYYYRPLGSDRPIGTDETDRPNIDATELLIVR